MPTNPAPMQQSMQALQSATQQGASNPGVNAIGALMTAAAQKTPHRIQGGGAPRGPGGSGVAEGINRASAEIGMGLRQSAQMKFAKQQKKDDQKFQMERMREERSIIAGEAARRHDLQINQEYWNSKLLRREAKALSQNEKYSYLKNHVTGAETLADAQARGAPGNPMQYAHMLMGTRDEIAELLYSSRLEGDPKQAEADFQRSVHEMMAEQDAINHGDADSISAMGHIEHEPGEGFDPETTMDYGFGEGQSIDVFHNSGLSYKQRLSARMTGELGIIALNDMQVQEIKATANKFVTMRNIRKETLKLKRSNERQEMAIGMRQELIGWDMKKTEDIRNPRTGQIVQEGTIVPDLDAFQKSARIAIQNEIGPRLMRELKGPGGPFRTGGALGPDFPEYEFDEEGATRLALKILMPKGAEGNPMSNIFDLYLREDADNELLQKTLDEGHIPHTPHNDQSREGQVDPSTQYAVNITATAGIGAIDNIMTRGTGASLADALESHFGLEDGTLDGPGVITAVAALTAVREKLVKVQSSSSIGAINPSIELMTSARQIDINDSYMALQIDPVNEGIPADELYTQAVLDVMLREAPFLGDMKGLNNYMEAKYGKILGVEELPIPQRVSPPQPQQAPAMSGGPPGQAQTPRPPQGAPPQNPMMVPQQPSLIPQRPTSVGSTPEEFIQQAGGR